MTAYVTPIKIRTWQTKYVNAAVSTINFYSPLSMFRYILHICRQHAPVLTSIGYRSVRYYFAPVHTRVYWSTVLWTPRTVESTVVSHHTPVLSIKSVPTIRNSYHLPTINYEVLKLRSSCGV